MKAPLHLCIACGLLLGFSPQLSHAQTTLPANLPGYWNLETNLTTHAYTIVRFYNGQDQLVYEETLPQLCLDLSKGSARCRQATAHQLTLALQEVLRDPASASQSTAELAQQLSQNHRVQRAYAAR